MRENRKTLLWIVLGVAIVVTLGVIGRASLMPSDPDDALMKVRRPVPASRRPPGQIGLGNATGPAGSDAPAPGVSGTVTEVPIEPENATQPAAGDGG